MSVDLSSFVKKLRVTDGAWGTELYARGLMPGSSPELWNADRPDAVEAVARSYVEAGSDVILTNTFGANRFILARHGVGERAVKLMEAGVAISKRAAGDAAKVFASMGPTGEIVMMEEVAPEKLLTAFQEVAAAAEWGGADAIILETFNELAELSLALEGAKEGCSLPVICSMTFASGPDQKVTSMGNKPADLATAAARGGADGVGANCGVGPDNYVGIAKLLRQATRLPVWIKANAGLPQMAPGGKTVYPMGPEEFASFVPAMAAAGADFIGGCCGTTPEHIAAIRKAVDAVR